MENEAAPVAGDAALLGFTDAAPEAPAMPDLSAMPAPAASDAAALDPMAFVAEPAAPAFAAEPAAPMPGGAASPTGHVDPFQGMPVKDTPAMGGASMIPEMNALREWEDSHERELEESARKEEAEKKEKKTAAADELAKWHQEREAANKKRIATNRSDEKSSEAARVEAQKPGANPWERVVDLIDTNARTADEARDTSRMRSLLIQLKSNPVVAAA